MFDGQRGVSAEPYLKGAVHPHTSSERRAYLNKRSQCSCLIFVPTRGTPSLVQCLQLYTQAVLTTSSGPRGSMYSEYALISTHTSSHPSTHWTTRASSRCIRGPKSRVVCSCRCTSEAARTLVVKRSSAKQSRCRASSVGNRTSARYKAAPDWAGLNRAPC